MANDILEVATAEAVELFNTFRPLKLDSGSLLANVTVAYETYGSLNSDGSNAVLICHALTANAHAGGGYSSNGSSLGWWDGLIGPGKAFDTDDYFVICQNILGSCYGTTGPPTINPITARPHRLDFPVVTVRDMVNVQKALLDVLGVNRLTAVCGSSLGGMQVLEWGIMYPDFCESIIPISTAAKQPAWCLALNAAARAAIKTDPEWNNGNYINQPSKGLALARMIGMISYRSPEEFEKRFGQQRIDASGDPLDVKNEFQVESYLRYQGKKLTSRFDANSYLYLTHAMDLHDVGRGRGSIENALARITARTLCMGVSSDIRYPKEHQLELTRNVPNAEYAEIDSIHGHDAFLIENEQLNSFIKNFLRKGHDR